MRTNTKFVECRYRFRSAAIMSGTERWPRALAAASFTAGGIETLSVSREAGQPLIPNQGRFGAIFE
jgi:hypothetical protein